MGTPDYDYTIDTSVATCRCDHVEISGKEHCLQGRAYAWTAQVEGWAHFFSATSLNRGVQSNCIFGYYKEFLNAQGTKEYAPTPKSCYSEVRWMEGRQCSAANRGTEWDWMNFYWRVYNKDSYAFGDFTDVYDSACGGSCNDVLVTWAQTRTAAEAVFGYNGAKAVAWRTQGGNYGVDH